MKVTKNDLIKLQKKYNMQFLRYDITKEGIGIQLTTENEIEELDNFLKETEDNELVGGTKSCWENEVTYFIYCPPRWINLWGWA